MSYIKHNFQNGDILTAEQLNEMDEQIKTNETPSWDNLTDKPFYEEEPTIIQLNITNEEIEEFVAENPNSTYYLIAEDITFKMIKSGNIIVNYITSSGDNKESAFNGIGEQVNNTMFTLLDNDNEGISERIGIRYSADDGDAGPTELVVKDALYLYLDIWKNSLNRDINSIFNSMRYEVSNTHKIDEKFMPYKFPCYEKVGEITDSLNKASVDISSSYVYWSDITNCIIDVQGGYFFIQNIFENIMITAQKDDGTTIEFNLVEVTSAGGGYGPSYNVARFIDENNEIEMKLRGTDGSRQAYVSMTYISDNYHDNPFKIVDKMSVTYIDTIIKQLNKKFIPDIYITKDDFSSNYSPILAYVNDSSYYTGFTLPQEAIDIIDAHHDQTSHSEHFEQLVRIVIYYNYSKQMYSYRSVFYFYALVPGFEDDDWAQSPVWTNGTQYIAIYKEDNTYKARLVQELPNSDKPDVLPSEEKDIPIKVPTDYN